MRYVAFYKEKRNREKLRSLIVATWHCVCASFYGGVHLTESRTGCRGGQCHAAIVCSQCHLKLPNSLPTDKFTFKVSACLFTVGIYMTL